MRLLRQERVRNFPEDLIDFSHITQKFYYNPY